MKDNNINALKDAGLKVTHPRTKILEVLQTNPEDHLTADAIHSYLASHNESIGLATVYRVLTQLEMAGLVQKNQFKENQSTYEIKKQHHDHLICTTCGKIIEFINDDLEKLQEKISEKYQFRLDSHVMTLFGECTNAKCKGKQ